MAVSIQAVWQAAEELAIGNGRAAPSLRLALWSAALSPRNDIDNNGRQVDNLRPYARGGLPLTGDTARDVAIVAAIVAQGDARKCTAVHAQAIVNIERMARSGELEQYRAMPTTVQGWLRWRAGVAKLYGMSWKTASFAALLLWPFDCPFVPVDTHVCGRLGRIEMAEKISDKNAPGYRRYRSLERLVFAEWRAAGRPVPIAVWHWYKWEERRQLVAMERKRGNTSDAVASHVGLSPYFY